MWPPGARDTSFPGGCPSASTSACAQQGRGGRLARHPRSSRSCRLAPGSARYQQCAVFFFKAISLRNTECGSSCLAIVNRFLCSLDRGNYSRTEFERCRPKERTCRSFFRSPIFERCERLRYYNSCGDTPAVLKKVTERSSTGVWTERRAFRVVSGSIFWLKKHATGGSSAVTGLVGRCRMPNAEDWWGVW